MVLATNITTLFTTRNTTYNSTNCVSDISGETFFVALLLVDVTTLGETFLAATRVVLALAFLVLLVFALVLRLFLAGISLLYILELDFNREFLIFRIPDLLTIS